MEQEILDKLGADWTHPVDILEPEEESALRQAHERYLQVMSHAMSWVLDADNPVAGAWAVSYALGLNQATKPMIETAADLGVERATLSAMSRAFCKTLHIPPSPAMKSEGACNTYKAIRQAQLKKQ